jgi:hypothetical protein
MSKKRRKIVRVYHGPANEVGSVRVSELADAGEIVIELADDGVLTIVRRGAVIAQFNSDCWLYWKGIETES